jgi:hypothetical protein
MESHRDRDRDRDCMVAPYHRVKKWCSHPVTVTVTVMVDLIHPATNKLPKIKKKLFSSELEQYLKLMQQVC